MSSQWSNLPTEILDIVFKYVDTLEKPDLSQCALTCRSWKMPAQKIYFRNIVIATVEDIYKFKHILSKRVGINLGLFVKELHYSCFDNTHQETFKLTLMDKMFPRLEHIEYCPSGGDLSASIFKMILDGRFKWLKRLPNPKSNLQDELYIKCAIMLKERLNHINITQNDIYGRNGTYEHLYNKLNQFSSLETISANITTRDSKTVWEYLESLLSLSTHGPLKKACLHISATSNNSTLSEKIDRIIPSYNLKLLKLSYYGVILNADINLLYIMKKFPNLSGLTIKYKLSPGLTQNFSTCSPRITVEFLKYIYNLSGSSKVQNIIINSQHSAEIINQFYDKIKFNAIDNRKLIIGVHNIYRSRYNETDLSQSAILSFITQSDKRKYTSLEFEFGANDQTQLQYMELIQKAGSKIYGGLFLDHVYVHSTTTLLDDIVKYCSNLQQLDISGGTVLGNYSLKATMKNYSLLNLSLRGYTLTKELLSFIEDRLCNLETLYIGSCFDSLQSDLRVPIYLPNTNLKSFHLCTVVYGDPLNNFKEISIRLRTATSRKTRYCHLIRTEPTNIDEQDSMCVYKIDKKKKTKKQFVLDSKNKECIVCDIYIKSVKKCLIEYERSDGIVDYVQLSDTD